MNLGREIVGSLLVSLLYVFSSMAGLVSVFWASVPVLDYPLVYPWAILSFFLVSSYPVALAFFVQAGKATLSPRLLFSVPAWVVPSSLLAYLSSFGFFVVGLVPLGWVVVLVVLYLWFVLFGVFSRHYLGVRVGRG